MSQSRSIFLSGARVSWHPAITCQPSSAHFHSHSLSLPKNSIKDQPWLVDPLNCSRGIRLGVRGLFSASLFVFYLLDKDILIWTRLIISFISLLPHLMVMVSWETNFDILICRLCCFLLVNFLFAALLLVIVQWFGGYFTFRFACSQLTPDSVLSHILTMFKCHGLPHVRHEGN